jgi:hypothetical protein
MPKRKTPQRLELEPEAAAWAGRLIDSSELVERSEFD